MVPDAAGEACQGRRAVNCTVLIADDDAVVLTVLGVVLDEDPRFTVVATAGSAEEAVAAARDVAPDLALVDVTMPGGGPSAVRGIARVSPATRIVALSGADDPETVRSMLDAGAQRYVVKAAAARELLEVLAGVMAEAGARTAPSGAPARPPKPAAAGVLLALTDGTELLAVADALAGEPGLEVVGLAQTPAHAATLAARHRPAVAIIDTALQPGGGRHAASLVRAACPDTAVIALDGDRRLDLLAPGTRGRAAAMLLTELVGRVNFATAEASPAAVRERVDRALAGDMMITLLQPVVDLRDGHSVGHEALTRFTLEPTQAPDAWFSQAASVGRGLDLEIAAAARALDFSAGMPGEGWLSINVSPSVAASPELDALLEDGIAERIVLEMTEHAPVLDYAELTSALQGLRRKGVRVAVDDAGAGFASLRHILLVAPDFIKLDMSLCRGIGGDPTRRAMARALAGFAAETGSTVVAEGLESAGDVEALLDLDVTLGQGYALGRPLPARRFARKGRSAPHAQRRRT